MKSFLIDRVRIHRGHMPVHLAFSYGKVSRFPFVLVRLSAGGVEGAGEVVVPSNEFLETFLPTLIGCDARGLDTLLPKTSSDHDRVLCETVSMALYDLVARLSGLPLRVLLGGAPSNLVPLMPCLFPNNPEEAATQALAFLAQGYRYLKVKLVGELREDVGRVTAIRSVAPAEVLLYGDANEGYHTQEEARTAVDECGAAGLDVFEDPLRGGVDDYAQLRRQARGAKIMVDVLARRTDDLLSILRAEAADIINIHPDQAGSMSRVLEHARLAQAFGVPVFMGGTGYTAVGSAVYQQLAAVATPHSPCGELGGVFDHGMPCSLVINSLSMQDGCVMLTQDAGSGVVINEEVLAQYEDSHQEWTG